MRKSKVFMNGKIINRAFLSFLFLVSSCWACCRAKSPEPVVDTNAVETILEQLGKNTKEFQSYQAQVEYKFSQPLLESESLRKGILYYSKDDEKSLLRINFQTLKQDDEKQQKYIEQFIFDGVWLTHIDYQIKAAKRHQLAEPNEPIDSFDLVSRNLPIIGFAKIEELKQQFEIQLVKQQQSEPSAFIKLHLKVKPDSIYKDDYTSIDFWLDRKLYLPAKVVALSTEDDIYEIMFLEPKINNKISKKVFEFEIPKGFTLEEVPLPGPQRPGNKNSKLGEND